MFSFENKSEAAGFIFLLKIQPNSKPEEGA